MSTEMKFEKLMVGDLIQQIISSSGVPLESPLRSSFETQLPANISKISSHNLYTETGKSECFVTSSQDDYEQEAEIIADSLFI